MPALAEAGYHAVAPWMQGLRAHGAGRGRRLPGGRPGLRRRRRCTRPWGGTSGRPRRPRLGRVRRLRGRRRCNPTGGGASSRWPSRPWPPRRRRSSPTAQMKRSFYIFLFQTPLAEMAVSADGHEFLDALWADWSPGYDAAVGRRPGERGHLRRPANLSAAIGYYRALFDPARHRADYEEAQVACDVVAPATHPVPARCRRRVHGPRRRRRCERGAVSRVGVRGGRGRRTLPAPRTARGRRDHVMRFLEA